MFKRRVTANCLKWVAIIAMVIDHIAWKITLSDGMFLLMHIIGRLTMPIMCYLLADGFYHTRSCKRYALRLLVFAVIAQIPFTYFMHGKPFVPWIGPETLNVLFCLLLGFCALWVIKSDRKKGVKIVLVALCLVFSMLCDWLIFGVLFILAFGLNRGSFKRQAMWFSIIAMAEASLINVMNISAVLGGDFRNIMQFGVLLALPLLAHYSGKKTGDNTPAWLSNKWFFYVFYPAHLAVLGVLHYGYGWLG